jgi:hypothetical protein
MATSQSKKGYESAVNDGHNGFANPRYACEVPLNLRNSSRRRNWDGHGTGNLATIKSGQERRSCRKEQENPITGSNATALKA